MYPHMWMYIHKKWWQFCLLLCWFNILTAWWWCDADGKFNSIQFLFPSVLTEHSNSLMMINPIPFSFWLLLCWLNILMAWWWCSSEDDDHNKNNTNKQQWTCRAQSKLATGLPAYRKWQKLKVIQKMCCISKYILQKIMVSLIVMPFIFVWYKNGYWLCKGQERWWARLVTCMWLCRLS